MAKSDKTEQPTPKKKRDSRKKGQIAKSQDLIGWTGLLVGLYILPLTIGRIASATAATLGDLQAVAARPDADLTTQILGDALRRGFLATVPLIAAVTITLTLASLAQTGLLLTWKPITPDLKRINPLKGLQRLFSLRSAWETVKQLGKILIIIAIFWPRLMGLFEMLVGHGRIPLSVALPEAGRRILSLVRTIAWTVFVLALADYAYQRYQHRQDLKMTKQEVRDEHKNTEGDGMVKARIRALQRSMARNR